ncbi:amidase [Thermoflavimicrobium dichotomicum]|uniref:Amidase n=1 Tax=Thermoflavimicrobium dichotomicum TaxID=46223 RepID=A0A1I3V639_9BACL|nr:amidase [Thermoflavimicrobium dichotomicum]SFJ89806.1 amidase [Thermoflavimicrobium dichotomicum]
MAVVKPTKDQLRRIAEQYHLELTEEELGVYSNLMEGGIASYTRLEQLVEPKLPVKYPRTPGYRPSKEENRLGAWYWKTSIKGEQEGPLSGKKIAIKDNVCVAGVPMMNGSALLEGYIPDVDATVVTRILEAGGEIVGKAVCEHLCLSGASHTSDTGPVRNPHNPEYSSGGSSSGSAVLVATGEADMAVGGDQGGSIRLPSSWCGVVGLKPTFGLVPYTGAFPIEQTLDHLGPIARTVADAALLLNVIAGSDGLDPRQSNLPKKDYLKAVGREIKGMRIGIVKEGFTWGEVSEPDVNELVRASAERFTELGAKVEEVSIPMHHDGIHIWNGIAFEGIVSLMVRGNGMGNNWKGYYTTSLLDAYGRGRLTRANDYSPTVKLVLLLGQYMETFYHGRYYAKAQNLARTLTQAYDDAFNQYDILLMPTTPQKATRIPAEDASVEEKIASALNMIYNTCPFNVTGHPAINVPCGFSQGLPVGMMLVGRKGEDDTVLQAAYAFEKIASVVKG